MNLSSGNSKLDFCNLCYLYTKREEKFRGIVEALIEIKKFTESVLNYLLILTNSLNI